MLRDMNSYEIKEVAGGVYGMIIGSSAVIIGSLYAVYKLGFIRVVGIAAGCIGTANSINTFGKNELGENIFNDRGRKRTNHIIWPICFGGTIIKTLYDRE